MLPSTSRNAERNHQQQYIIIVILPPGQYQVTIESLSASTIYARNTSHSNIANSNKNMIYAIFLQPNDQKLIAKSYDQTKINKYHEARNTYEKPICAFGALPGNAPNVTHAMVSARCWSVSSQIKGFQPSPRHSSSSARPCATRFRLQNSLQTSQSQNVQQSTNNETPTRFSLLRQHTLPSFISACTHALSAAAEWAKPSRSAAVTLVTLRDVLK